MCSRAEHTNVVVRCYLHSSTCAALDACHAQLLGHHAEPWFVNIAWHVIAWQKGVGLTLMLGTSWDKGCMAASASGNSAAGLRNQIRLVGVYGQLVGLRLPL
jgi:hypothetical protein